MTASLIDIILVELGAFYRMTITLTPELELLIDRKVKSGRYNSAGEVVREALEQLDEKDRIKEAHLEEIRAKIIEAEEDFESGRFITINSEAESRELAERIIRRGYEKLSTLKSE